jgi:pentatricopeptide repeat protein
MYKTQSLQNFGILVDAAYNLSDKAKAVKANNSAENQAALKAAKTQMATAISSQITSAVILGVMTALGRALLHKMVGYRDDKGDLTAESVGGQILKDSVSSVAGMVVGGTEAFDLINGLIEGQSPFDIEAAGVSTINDLYQNLFGFGEAMKVIGDKELTNEQKMNQVWPKLRKMGLSVTQLLGLPVGNFLNLLDGIAANAADFATGKAGTFASKSPLQIAGTALIGSAQGRETSNKAVAGDIAKAMMDGNQAEAVRLYNEQLRQGKTADALNTAIATWQKENIPEIRQAAEAIEAGDITEYNRLINQLTEMGLSMTNAVKYVEAERKKGEKGNRQEAVGNSGPSVMTYDEIVSGMTKATANSEQNAYTNGMMNSLLEDGNVEAAMAVRDDMLKNGNKKLSAINSSLTSFWKPRIQEAYANGDMEEVRRITNMLVQMGMKRTTITGWTSNTKSTSSSSSKKSGFGSGSFGSGGFGSSSKKSSSKKKSGFGSGSFGSGSFGR